jgi:hypothetical protein
MPGGEGRVQVQVSAGAGAQLTQLRFGEPRPSTNALIDVAEQVGRTGTFTVELAPPAASVTFVVRSAAPGPGATVHLVVRDTCGDWPTFVGAGPAVLGTPAPTVPNTIAVPDGTGSVGWYLSLRLDASGRPVMSYQDFGQRHLRVLHCGNPTCTTANATAVADPAGTVGWDTSLALDPSGVPVVSYFDAFVGQLVVLRCGNATCTSNNAIARPDGAGRVGGYTSLALDAGWRPVVSYYDFANRDLKVLRCGDQACTSGNAIATLDSAGDVGSYTSLALDAGGVPVVSYYDATNGDLKVLQCGNPTCTGGNSIAAPDTTGDVGRYSALRLDASGHPVVGYFDMRSGSLTVLRCGSPGCSP